MLHFIVATAGMLAIGWLVFRLLQRQERQSGDDRPKAPRRPVASDQPERGFGPGGGGTGASIQAQRPIESAAERKGASVGPEGRTER